MVNQGWSCHATNVAGHGAGSSNNVGEPLSPFILSKANPFILDSDLISMWQRVPENFPTEDARSDPDYLLRFLRYTRSKEVPDEKLFLSSIPRSPPSPAALGWYVGPKRNVPLEGEPMACKGPKLTKDRFPDNRRIQAFDLQYDDDDDISAVHHFNPLPTPTYEETVGPLAYPLISDEEIEAMAQNLRNIRMRSTLTSPAPTTTRFGRQVKPTREAQMNAQARREKDLKALNRQNMSTLKQSSDIKDSYNAHDARQSPSSTEPFSGFTFRASFPAAQEIGISSSMASGSISSSSIPESRGLGASSSASNLDPTEASRKESRVQQLKRKAVESRTAGGVATSSSTVTLDETRASLSELERSVTWNSADDSVNKADDNVGIVDTTEAWKPFPESTSQGQHPSEKGKGAAKEVPISTSDTQRATRRGRRSSAGPQNAVGSSSAVTLEQMPARTSSESKMTLERTPGVGPGRNGGKDLKFVLSILKGTPGLNLANERIQILLMEEERKRKKAKG